MNNTFDFNRFSKVVGKDCRNLWPMYGPTMLILIVLPFAMWLLLALTSHNTEVPPDLRMWMINGLAAVAALMAPSRLYRTMNLRGEGIYYAMLPASKLEKYLSMVLYSVVVCPLIVLVGGILFDMLLTLLPMATYTGWLWQGEMGFPFAWDWAQLLEHAETEYLSAGWLNVGAWGSYLFSVALFMFTATLFKKHKVLFTLLCLWGLSIVLSWVAVPIGVSLTQSADFMDWLAELIEGKSVAEWASIVQVGYALVEWVAAAVMLYFTWWRLKRMNY